MPLDGDFYKKLRAQSKRFTGVLLKDGNLLILVGLCMYIAYLVMSLQFYWPSYIACIGIDGNVWFILNAIVQSLFLLALFLWGCSDIIPPTVARSYSKFLPTVVGFCTFYFLVVYIMFYTQCSNRKCPYGRAATNGDGCDVEELTAFNTRVLRMLNNDTAIDVLYKYYKDNSRERISIANCRKYYNGTFLQEQIMTDRDIYSNLEQVTCDPDADDSVECVTNSTPGVGAPTLSEFFVMTSARTVVVGDQYDGYVSPRMILVALVAGARCLDFDVSNYGYAIDAPPIVSVFRDRDNTNLMRNFVLLESCFRTIMDWWSGDAQHRQDPLFLRLNFRRGLTVHTMSRIADMIYYYFNELDGKHLLGSGGEDSVSLWSFRNNRYGSLGQTPICNMFKRIVIMVRSPFVRPPDRLLDLVNAYHGVGFPHHSKQFVQYDWKGIKDVTDKERLKRYNKAKLTYVETTYSPYSDASPIMKRGEGGLYNDPSAKYTKDDGAMVLMMNKQTINNDPIVSLKAGCQFVAMNFQNTDTDLALYMSLFHRSSLMLKPKSMRRRIPLRKQVPVAVGCTESETTYERRLGDDNTSCMNGFEFVCLDEKAEDIHNEIARLGFTKKKKEETCLAQVEIEKMEKQNKKPERVDPGNLYIDGGQTKLEVQYHEKFKVVSKSNECNT